MSFDIEGIDHVSLSVSDIDRSVAWYGQLLGLERWHKDAWGSNPAVIGKGSTALALFPARSGESAASISPEIPSFRHLAFRADRDNFARAQKDLAERQIEYLFEDHGISHSVYFSDPDGHELEITTYEV